MRPVVRLDRHRNSALGKDVHRRDVCISFLIYGNKKNNNTFAFAHLLIFTCVQVYIDLLYRATFVHVPTGAPAPPRNPSGNPGTAGSGAQGPWVPQGCRVPCGQHCAAEHAFHGGAGGPILDGRAYLHWAGERVFVGQAGGQTRLGGVRKPL